MLIPMGCMSALTLIIGLASPFICSILPLEIFPHSGQYLDYNIASVVMVLVYVSIIVFAFICFIAVLFFVKKLLTKKSQKYVTWGCGYDKGNNHIQYTASSYVSPFTSILTPLFKKIFDVKKPKGLFPKEAHYSSDVEDVEEAYIINPILKFDEKFLSRFERLQDGNIQHYILYGLIFLILVLVGVVFIG